MSNYTHFARSNRNSAAVGTPAAGTESSSHCLRQSAPSGLAHETTTVRADPLLLLQLSASELSILHRATSSSFTVDDMQSKRWQEKKNKLSKILFQPSSRPDTNKDLVTLNQCNKYNSRGHCIYHPHIRLRKKRNKKNIIFNKFSSEKQQWQILHISCPSCSIENTMKLSQSFDLSFGSKDCKTASITRRSLSRGSSSSNISLDSSTTSAGSSLVQCHIEGGHGTENLFLSNSLLRQDVVFRDGDDCDDSSQSHSSYHTLDQDQDDDIEIWIEVPIFSNKNVETTTDDSLISNEHAAEHNITHALVDESNSLTSLIDIANHMYQDWQCVFGDNRYECSD